MADPEMLRELFDYVGFGADDAVLLARVGREIRASFPTIVDEFYEALEANERARAVFTGGKAQIDRQKHRLGEWLEGVVGGVYDDAYFERRARIGRVHVQIELDQRYMFGAMSVIRSGLHRALRGVTTFDAEERARATLAIDRICDIELAIMLETYRERYVERLRANERLATIGQIAASIGHELRNPLAVMESSVHLLRRRVQGDETASRHFDRIGQQVALSSSIIDELLALARDRPSNREPVSFEELAREATDAVPRPKTVHVALDVEGSLPPVWLDRTQVRQVVINLVGNAVEAITGSGVGTRVDVRAWIEGGALVCTVTDDGPGVAAEVRGELFEPLVTTRKAGIGLGLALCKRIVQKHHGTVDAEHPAEGGARFVVRIPDATEAPA